MFLHYANYYYVLAVKGLLRKTRPRLPLRSSRKVCHHTREERGRSATLWFYYRVGVLPTVNIHQFDKVDTTTADERGRVTIGVEFADEEVKLYVERVDSGE